MQLARKYALYLVRWQLSTPILAVCVAAFIATLGATGSTVLANLVGGLIFFWVDRWIFRHTDILRGEVWEAQQDIVCADCGRPVHRGYRLVKARDYDRTQDREPEFRCPDCSRAKYERWRAAGAGESDSGGPPPA